MEKSHAVAALAALAQDNRLLDVYRLLVQAGPDGMAAGHMAERLGLAPNTLTFHFDRLPHSRLGHCSSATARCAWHAPACTLPMACTARLNSSLDIAGDAESIGYARYNA